MQVNHLYSTELFPTVIRNMARAVCNLGSRSGSLIGPQVNIEIVNKNNRYSLKRTQIQWNIERLNIF